MYLRYTQSPLKSYLAWIILSKTIIAHQAYPYANPVLMREGYTLAYDERAKTALWVYEDLTPEMLQGNAKRSEKFVQDPDIPALVQANSSDYKYSGFDRGHLAPAADYLSNQDAMDETFYLSNISPQVPQFNREYWLKLEKYVGDLTRQYGRVQAVTGPPAVPAG